jgi:hypothetical protein
MHPRRKPHISQEKQEIQAIGKGGSGISISWLHGGMKCETNLWVL